MRLTIDGIPRQFEPIRAFRAAHDLPPSFGVALFEPKDYSGLGRIDAAGTELNGVRAALLAALPAQMPLRNWLTFLPQLTSLFTAQLNQINPKVRLHEVEIEFAAAGFADVCQAVVYALLRGSAPPFEAIYGEWLDQTARVSQTVHSYGAWRVQIVTHAYGRAGLIVSAGEAVHYVADAALGCPAEGFMAALLAEVAGKIALSV
ncbi:MAG: hypothetical protein ABI835_10665 [Chloroflexota bacterium]